MRSGTPLATLLARHDWRLDTHALAPWSRWITPRRPTMMNRRFDTRFFWPPRPPHRTSGTTTTRSPKHAG
ncbi:hypothetical protein ACFSTJ_03335 [Ottowia pentelensis]|uniref:hypothetical protein n=1 Tax=Ottowia pentelensis TaxID=511108 RepID=UPI0036371764